MVRNLILLISAIFLSTLINVIHIVITCKNASTDSWCGFFNMFFLPVLATGFFIIFLIVSLLIKQNVNKNGLLISFVWVVLSFVVSAIFSVAFFQLGGQFIYSYFHLLSR